MPKKILGIVGSYRKGGVVDTLVSEALKAAQEAGAETAKVYLIDKHVEFCANCRKCTQEPGPGPGQCVHDDDIRELLNACLASDGLVLGAPVNFYNVNAVTRRFMERLVCLTYWPWQSHGGPKMRLEATNRKAVVVTSAAMPRLLMPLFTGALRALKSTAKVLGARTIGSIYVGLMADAERPAVPGWALEKARVAGRRLAAE